MNTDEIVAATRKAIAQIQADLEATQNRLLFQAENLSGIQQRLDEIHRKMEVSVERLREKVS